MGGTTLVSLLGIAERSGLLAVAMWFFIGLLGFVQRLAVLKHLGIAESCIRTAPKYCGLEPNTTKHFFQVNIQALVSYATLEAKWKRCFDCLFIDVLSYLLH